MQHACPEVFGFDEQGFALVASDEVPPELEEAVRTAELRCPERAIELRDGPGDPLTWYGPPRFYGVRIGFRY